MSCGLNIAFTPVGDQNSINATRNMNRYCGANDCPSKLGTNRTISKSADPESVTILMAVFSAAVFLSGIFILLFVDSLKTESNEKKVKIKSQLYAVMKMSFKDKRMLFLLPIQIYAGLLPGFVAVDFSKVFFKSLMLM